MYKNIILIIMNIKKVILIFLLILAIIILLNKKKVGEHLTQNEAMNNYLTMIDTRINTEFNKNLGNRLLKNKICDEQKNCLSFQKMRLFNSPLNQYMYLPTENIMWKNLYDKKDSNFREIGEGYTLDNSQQNWESTGKPIYRISTPNNVKQTIGKGIEIDVPEYPNNNQYNDISGTDFTVLWVQVPGNTWATFRVHVKNEDNQYESFGSYVGGLNYLNNISPDGGIHNENWNKFEWYPVPIKINNERKVIISNPYDKDTWFSGFAFSTNPWNHCRISALTLHYNLNRDEENITYDRTMISWETHNGYNNEPLAVFANSKTSTFKIPFVNSGKDKIFYVIEHNSNWGPGVVSVSCNGDPIDNLSTSFDNPFARHFNSKIYQRYLATIIPKEYIQTTDKYIEISITIPVNSGKGLYFTEVGTHDVNPFDPIEIVE